MSLESATDLLHYVDAAAAVVLAIIALLQAHRGGEAGRWGAAAFAGLAIVLLLDATTPQQDGELTATLLVSLLLLFPLLLLCFTASFGAVDRRFLRVCMLATGVMLLVTAALPLGAPGDARPAWVLPYLAVMIVFWTMLSGVTIVSLWRAGAGQPTVGRRRARLMSAATAGLNVLLLLATTAGRDGVWAVVIQLLLLLTLLAFAVGYAPPALVRQAWREPEQEALASATEQLIRAHAISEVTATLLPHVARIIGGSGASLIGADGEIIAVHGETPANGGQVERVPLSPPFGALVVTTNSFTPFFGREELTLLHNLAALIDLALARCLLREHEEEQRVALQRATDEAQRANMAKSDFLSRMSHELRTPLNVVLGFGQILELRGSLDGRDSEAVEHILKAGRHLLELINEVLDLARIEAGRMTVSPEPVEVAEMVADALALIAPLAQPRSVRLTSALAHEHAYVTADRQRLKQVLLNLLSNAVKYNRDGGSVTVASAARPGDRLRLSVTDTGAGIPPAMLERLFAPFERLDAEHGHIEGTGLGLALARELVQLMGGEIGVESRDGEGSTFWIDLALAEPVLEPARERVDRHEDPYDGGHDARNVLLVEDNLANVKVIEALLGDRPGIQVVPAMTGRLGLQLARDLQPDLILLDHHLPDINGSEVLHRLRADPDTSDIPVVIVSADATPGQIRRLREIGAADYLTKPLDVPNFLAVLDRLLTPSWHT